MNEVNLFLKWDAVLLYRNRLFHIALLIALIYTGVFFLLKPLGNLDNVLVVLIFNDPVVTGYIFGGVIWLFDKNQHTLQAVSVLPVRRNLYLLSKILILSGLAVLVSVVMALAARGLDFNWFHLIFSVFYLPFYSAQRVLAWPPSAGDLMNSCFILFLSLLFLPYPSFIYLGSGILFILFFCQPPDPLRF